MPKSVEQALAADEGSGTTFWKVAIAKEKGNTCMVFQFMGDDRVSEFRKDGGCHMVLDVGTDLTHKSRYRQVDI